MNAITNTAEAAAIEATAQPRLAIFFDTETTGFPAWNQPSESDVQPHLVELAAQVVDLDTRIVVYSMDMIIKPVGWIIPDECVRLHGITTERAMDEGIPEEEAVERFYELWAYRHRVAFNFPFDERIMRIAFKRYLDPRDPALALQPSDEWKATSKEDAMRMASPILNLPPTEKMRGGRKQPNLAEAYQFFTGEPMRGAHRAAADTEACKVVYFGCIDHAQKVAA